MAILSMGQRSESQIRSLKVESSQSEGHPPHPNGSHGRTVATENTVVVSLLRMCLPLDLNSARYVPDGQRRTRI